MSQAYIMGAGMSTKDAVLSGYTSMLNAKGTPYEPISERVSQIKGFGKKLDSIYTSVINYIKKIVENLLGTDVSNVIFKDVLYIESLLSANRFMKPYSNSTSSEWIPTEESKELIPCK
jgi:hypothetical protein